MKFANPYIPQMRIEAEPRWKGIIRGYFLFVTYWRGHKLKAFVTQQEYEDSTLPTTELR